MFLVTLQLNEIIFAAMSELVLAPLKGEIALLWRNLSVFRPLFQCKPIHDGSSCDLITDNITGFINFGEMTAILGPSGAGKTSILRCLYGTSRLKYFGEIFVNSANKGAVFITQAEDDHLLQSLTVEECVYFACRLKSSTNSNTDRVNDLLFQLGLDACRNNLVKHCSGGQKKRLTIAQELAGEHMPGIVLMDEPTSGLDSKASFVLMTYLQKLCKKYEIALVTSIHQPSYTLLRLFNNIFVMSLSGKFVFYGNPDNIPYCLNQASIKIPEGCNPVDILLEAASLTDLSEAEPFEDYLDAIGDVENGTSITLNNATILEDFTDQMIKDEIQNRDSKNLIQVSHLFQSEAKVCWSHIKLLLRRMLINDTIRDPSSFLIKILVHVLTGLSVVYFYTNAAASEDGCLPDVNHIPTLKCQYEKATYWKKFNLVTSCNFIFYNFFLLTLTSLISAILAVTAEMKIFINEHRNGWYSTASHYISRNIIEILFQIPLPYIYFLLTSFSAKQFTLNSFWEAIPFTDRSHFKDLAVIGILSSIVTQGIGFAISAIFSRSIAFFVGFTFFMVSFVLSNFLIRFQSGSVSYYVSLFSFARWMIEASVTALYGDRCNVLNPDQITNMKSGIISIVNKTNVPQDSNRNQ
ncbi:ABC transporter sub-family G-like protein 1 [Leptotrombidium deliense]|uniref:ABC transporter sub-family G-like protein 1 n=1 Tax=Leptotrombidium deliense TaxID=299467 RepID=A0A443SRC9_9ACAR|nr:ABC transporter sub-family G-like protein 1 [Leptotrombidium deliense]